MAFEITLTTLAPNRITTQGNGPCGTGGQGIGPGVAKAVSMVRRAPEEPQPIYALAGITEGAQYNIEATVTTLTILRSFMAARPR